MPIASEIQNWINQGQPYDLGVDLARKYISDPTLHIFLKNKSSLSVSKLNKALQNALNELNAPKPREQVREAVKLLDDERKEKFLHVAGIQSSLIHIDSDEARKEAAKAVMDGMEELGAVWTEIDKIKINGAVKRSEEISIRELFNTWTNLLKNISKDRQRIRKASVESEKAIWESKLQARLELKQKLDHLLNSNFIVIPEE